MYQDHPLDYQLIFCIWFNLTQTQQSKPSFSLLFVIKYMKNQSSPVVRRFKNFSYIPEDKIGQGATGKVYKGINQQNGEQVAIKILEMSAIDNEVTQYLLACEKQALLSIANPYVLSAYDIVQTQDQCLMVTPLCTGGTLKEYIKSKGKLCENQALSIFVKLLRGYQGIRDKGFIHRDLKSSNIMFKNGEPVIIDFGYCEKNHGKKPKIYYNVGSPSYMSPQAYYKTIYSEKSDVWALGIILFEMMQGFTIDSGQTIDRYFTSLLRNGFQMRSQVNIQTYRMLVQMLNPNANARPGVESLIQRVERIIFQGNQQPTNMRPTNDQNRNHEPSTKISLKQSQKRLHQQFQSHKGLQFMGQQPGNTAQNKNSPQQPQQQRFPHNIPHVEGYQPNMIKMSQSIYRPENQFQAFNRMSQPQHHQQQQQQQRNQMPQRPMSVMVQPQSYIQAERQLHYAHIHQQQQLYQEQMRQQQQQMRLFAQQEEMRRQHLEQQRQQYEEQQRRQYEEQQRRQYEEQQRKQQQQELENRKKQEQERMRYQHHMEVQAMQQQQQKRVMEQQRAQVRLREQQLRAAQIVQAQQAQLTRQQNMQQAQHMYQSQQVQQIQQLQPVQFAPPGHPQPQLIFLSSPQPPPRPYNSYIQPSQSQPTSLLQHDPTVKISHSHIFHPPQTQRSSTQPAPHILLHSIDTDIRSSLNSVKQDPIQVQQILRGGPVVQSVIMSDGRPTRDSMGEFEEVVIEQVKDGVVYRSVVVRESGGSAGRNGNQAVTQSYMRNPEQAGQRGNLPFFLQPNYKPPMQASSQRKLPLYSDRHIARSELEHKPINVAEHNFYKKTEPYFHATNEQPKLQMTRVKQSSTRGTRQTTIPQLGNRMVPGRVTGGCRPGQTSMQQGQGFRVPLVKNIVANGYA